MPVTVQYLKNISVTPEKENVLVRLGGRKSSIVDPVLRRMLEEGMKRGQLNCHPAGAYLSLKIMERASDVITLENGNRFQSQSLARLLANSDEAVLMASTVGPEIVRLIHTEISQRDAAMGVILDAVASETADAVLDWLMNYLNGMLAPKGRKLTKHRYSPGYGDLPLQYQQMIFSTLMLEKMGLELTEKCMLVPEKSVIALAGVEGK